MTWDAVGAVAELLGALGVIVTLVYLAAQIRQNSAVTRTSNYWQLTSQMSEFSNQLAGDPALLDVYQRGVGSYSGLSEPERGTFHMLLSGLFTKYQVMLQLKARGQLDAQLYDDMFSGIMELLALPGIQEWWREEGRWFADSFRAFVDVKLESLES